MRGREHAPLVGVLKLLICGLLAGVVVAGAAFPALAFSGLLARSGVRTFEALPSELSVERTPQASEVYAADGRTLLTRFFDENRRDVLPRDVSPHMKSAIVAAEDHSFFAHRGVDVRGVVRSFVSNSAGGERQGASTLTMQLVRMSITYSAADPAAVAAASEDTAIRKVREARLAVQMEKTFSKEQILQRYLNIAAFGNGTYGVHAASRLYFGKHPRDLTIDESALLAALVRSPSLYDPLTTKGHQRAVDRRDWVIDQMVEIGRIDPGRAAAAKAVTLAVRGERPRNGCAVTTPNHWGFFCDHFYRWWMAQEAFGGTAYDRERGLKGGGYRIVTTLDPKIQNAAQQNVGRQLSTRSRDALMVAAIEPGTGWVRALATNRVFGLDDPLRPRNRPASNPAEAARGIRGSYPTTMNPLLTGDRGLAGYQAGSTFKIFTVVAALEKGYPLAYTIDAPRVYRSAYTGASGGSACRGSDRYCPRNDNDGMAGVHNMWTAFGRSVNTFFVPLQERVGAAEVVDAARRLGIAFRSPADAARAGDAAAADAWGSFTLGVSATTPLDLANAYATLAADGMRCEPIPVLQIRDRAGQSLDVARPRCHRAVRPAVARAAIDVARCPVGDQSAFGECRGATEADAHRVVGHPVAGKTGTTDSHRSASLVVTTRSLAVAGILADPDWPETTRDMDHDVVNPTVYRTLAAAMKGKPQRPFARPANRIAYGQQRTIPDLDCRPLARAVAALREAGFTVRVDPTPVASPCPAGTVAATEPSGAAARGGFVVIRTSRGRQSRP
jgi:membrane peptidoglycan carboxypeptidase